MAATRGDVRRRVRPQRDDPGGISVERPFDPREGPDTGWSRAHVAAFDQRLRPEIADLEDEGHAQGTRHAPSGKGAEQVRAGADDHVGWRKLDACRAGARRARRKPACSRRAAWCCLRTAGVRNHRKRTPSIVSSRERLCRLQPRFLARDVIEARGDERDVVTAPVERRGKGEVARDTGLGGRDRVLVDDPDVHRPGLARVDAVVEPLPSRSRICSQCRMWPALLKVGRSSTAQGLAHGIHAPPGDKPEGLPTIPGGDGAAHRITARSPIRDLRQRRSQPGTARGAQVAGTQQACTLASDMLAQIGEQHLTGQYEKQHVTQSHTGAEDGDRHQRRPC